MHMVYQAVAFNADLRAAFGHPPCNLPGSDRECWPASSGGGVGDDDGHAEVENLKQAGYVVLHVLMCFNCFIDCVFVLLALYFLLSGDADASSTSGNSS